MSIYSIYKATNTINGKVYIGFDSAWPKRQQDHLKSAQNASSPDAYTVFHQALREEGPDAFTWEVICQSKNGEYLLNTMERYFIESFNSHYLLGHGYNMTLGGDGSLGVKRTEEIKNKQREAALRRWNSPEGMEERKRRSEEFKGEKNPQYGKEGTMKGKTLSEEVKKDLSEQAKERYQDPTKHPRYGATLTEETKEKISKSKTGKTLSPEHIEKVRKSRIGKHQPESQKQKVAEKLAKTYELTSPTGEIIIVKNLSKWCKENNLSNSGNMINNHVKGWKCKKLPD